ncbi:MAG TPA: hypothetical protein VKH81_03865 [Candidatus Angelobacter sp.]|nr:hypothetical protein [Candidatus Angelobacter sp.]
MAGVPRNLPMPRGSLSLGLAEYYANEVVSSAASVTASAGNFANIGLFNQSATGQTIYVVGCTIWCSASSGAVILQRRHAGIGGGSLIEPSNLSPMFGQRDGQMFINPNGVTGMGSPVWSFSGGGYPTDWPYDSPITILPSGWQVYTDPPADGCTIAAAFRWLVLKS